MGAAGDDDRGFGDLEMLREELNQCCVGLAVVRSSAKIDSKLAEGGFNDLLL